MRIRTTLLTLVAFSMILGSAGCRANDAEPAGSTCPTQVFDLADRAEPLGPSDELIRAFDRAAGRVDGPPLETTTMAEMAGAAGWSPDWDRVIFMGAGMTDEHLRRYSGIDLRVACFTGWPRWSSDPDLRSPHATLFMLNGKPVQAVLWTGQNPTLDFGERDFLTPDTVFRYNSSRRIMEAE